MAKFKVLKEFKLLDDPKVPGKGTVHQPEEVIDITVKRADQVVKTLGGSFLERIDNKNEGIVEESVSEGMEDEPEEDSDSE